jgi:hypothetical protein
VTSRRYFAMYIEYTRTVGHRRERWQFLVTPPMATPILRRSATASDMEAFERTGLPIADVANRYWVRHRFQYDEGNRPVWRIAGYKQASVVQDFVHERLAPLDAKLALPGQTSWRACRPVTVELSPQLCASAILNHKTPYKILDRVKKVAHEVHNLDIS